MHGLYLLCFRKHALERTYSMNESLILYFFLSVTKTTSAEVTTTASKRCEYLEGQVKDKVILYVIFRLGWNIPLGFQVEQCTQK